MDCTDKLSQSQLARIGIAFSHKHPELFNALIEKYTPTLTDIGYIRIMYNSESIRNDDHFDKDLLFVAAVLHLYCPGALYCGLRNLPEINKELKCVMGHKYRERVARHISKSRLLLKNKRFLSKLTAICSQFESAYIALSTNNLHRSSPSFSVIKR